MTSSLFEAASPLAWNQPSAMQREYDLQAGDKFVGHLRFEKSFGSLASAKVDNQEWTFKREGFLHPRVTVRVPNSPADVAVFHATWSGGGTVSLTDGHEVDWRCTNFWKSEWSFSAKNGQLLIRFHRQTGILKVSAQMEIDSAGADSPDLRLLIALGWYLMLLAAQDAAIVVATTIII
jgi:hypothetical protein